MKTALLIIDAQYDFCNPKGSLFVPGAPDDVKKIAALITDHSEEIDAIFVTLDTHQVMDIAHPLFWEDAQGYTVAPFTLITPDAIEKGKFRPRYDPEYVNLYFETLEKEGEFKHFIWPEHCLIGTPGAALDETISDAILFWCHRNNKDYTAILKGQNPFTEHFGVFQAQVPIATDMATQLNTGFLNQLEAYDRILVTGEARSHCVATSVKQILNHAPLLVPKLVILTDCMSDVTNFGYLADPIFEAAKTAGALFSTADALKFH